MGVAPSRYVILDTETRSSRAKGPVPTQELRLRLGVALIYDGDVGRGDAVERLDFDASDQFHSRLAAMPHSKTPIYVYAHNMGFDARIVEFMRWLAVGKYSLMPPEGAPNRGRYKEPLFIAESPPFIVRLWRPDGQQIILLDTYQWLRRSLSEIGSMIGFAKSDMPSEDKPDCDWYDYCHRDCLVLGHALRRVWAFLDSMRVPRHDYTPASQAMSLYRMRFERKRVIRPQDPDVFGLERLAYYGGQVEAFRLGIFEENIYQLDVTSLYPYVMEQSLYPCEVIDRCDDPTPTCPGMYFDPRCHTAEVWLETADWPWPVRGSDETLYVRGHVRTVLCGPELERAWNSGHVRYIGRWIKYRLDDLFSGYVHYLWAIREGAKRRGDKLTDDLCKAMLNSLHGKFGQRTGDWQYRDSSQPRGMFCAGRVVGEDVARDTEFRVLAGSTYTRCRTAEDPRGFVPIASWTSSYARCYMYDARSVAGEDHVYYQATDSLLVDGVGLGQLQLAGMVDGNRLGTFRHEETHKWLALHGVNMLETDRKRQRPGVKKTARELSSETYEQEDWESFVSGIYQGNVSSVFIRSVVKHIKMGCRRRRYDPRGGSEPWVIDNWGICPEDQKSLPVRP